MTDPVHAERREPSVPTGAFDLAAAGRDLLEQAGEMAAGRAARTLTPGAGALLKQTLVALEEGRELDEHTAPGPATLQVLSGQVTLRTDDTTLPVAEHGWVTLPTEAHGLHADRTAVVLITVAQPQSAG
jgi:quercetin dioxygenase-like cupin family protein